MQTIDREVVNHDIFWRFSNQKIRNRNKAVSSTYL